MCNLCLFSPKKRKVVKDVRAYILDPATVAIDSQVLLSFWPYGGVGRDTLQDVRFGYNVTTDIIMDVAMGAYIRPKI